MEGEQHSSENFNRSVVIWNYEGRDIPMEVFWPMGDEEDRVLDALAQFLWENRRAGLAEPVSG